MQLFLSCTELHSAVSFLRLTGQLTCRLAPPAILLCHRTKRFRTRRLRPAHTEPAERPPAQLNTASHGMVTIDFAVVVIFHWY